MEAFQGVFAKRGEKEVVLSPCATTGSFESVFVKRQGYKKDAANCPEQSAAGQQTSTKQSRAEKAFMTLQNEELIVKNTFFDTAVVEFDSLQDFFMERKVKSCPASRQGSEVTENLIDGLLAGTKSNLLEEVLNTASSMDDASIMLVLPKDGAHFDDAGSAPSGSTDSGATSEDFVNTGCTWSDSEPGFGLESVSQRSSDAAIEELEDQASTAAERLRNLRLKGSVIQETMQRAPSQQSQPVSASQAGTVINRQLPIQLPTQWIVNVQTPEGIRQGIVTLLGNAQPAPQQSFATPLPTEPPSIPAGYSDPSTAPPTAPVIQLADAIAPPEIGTTELPSIGSLLHHTGECKPCTFFHSRGCENEANCKFCHLCGPGEKKKRLRAQKAAQRDANLATIKNCISIPRVPTMIE